MTTRIDLPLLLTVSDFDKYSNDPASLNQDLLKTERIDLEQIDWIESRGYKISYELIDKTAMSYTNHTLGSTTLLSSYLKICKFYIDIDDIDAVEYKLRFNDQW